MSLRQDQAFQKNALFCLLFTTSFFYITWRLLFTLPLRWGTLSLILGVVLWLAEAFSLVESFTHFNNARSVVMPEMPVIREDQYPDVDVLITTHNEAPSLLHKTINGCLHMRYPDPARVHIYLCDDGDRPEMKALAERMGIGYFGFTGNQHAKAGNLNHALPLTHAPLIALFDADMIPTSDFLLETVPYFFDETASLRKPLGYVQTRQSFYNPDPLQRNLYKERSAPNEQDYFYRAINVARMHTDSAAFAGSNAVISRKALEDIGGFGVHSIAEDCVTGMSILGKGYRSIAVDKELAHGLSPSDTRSFIRQRQRWSRGAAQGITSARFWKSGMPPKAKWNFFVSYAYWWTFVRRLLYILVPILYGVLGLHLADATFFQLMVVWLPYRLLYSSGLLALSEGTTNPAWSGIIDTIQFPYMLRPIIAGTLMIPQKTFIVTPKESHAGRNSSLTLAIPHMILALLTLITAIVCVYQITVQHAQGAIIVLIWSVYNLYTLLTAIVYYIGRVNDRSFERIPVSVPVSLRSDGRTLEGTTLDISERGMAVRLATPEFLPNDRDIEVYMADNGYQATMQARVIQVSQLDDGSWKYNLKVSTLSEDDLGSFLQIIYDRSNAFPRRIDTGVYKDLRALYRGLTTQVKRAERRMPRLSLYARLPSPEVDVLYVINCNYKYVLLHGLQVLPDVIHIDFSNDIRLTCIKSEKLNDATPSTTQLYQIEGWETLALRTDFRARLMQLAAMADEAQEDPALATLSIAYGRAVQAKQALRHRRLIAVAVIAAILFPSLAFLPDPAGKTADRIGIPAAQVRTLYARGQTSLAQGQYEEALRALGDIGDYRDADRLYAQARRAFREEALAQAQTLQLAGQYPEALNVLHTAQTIVPDDALLEAKDANVRQKYIRTAFDQADAYVAADQQTKALETLQALENVLGQDDRITEKMNALSKRQ